MIPGLPCCGTCSVVAKRQRSVTVLDLAASAVKYTRQTTELLARRDQVKVPSIDTGMAVREM